MATTVKTTDSLKNNHCFQEARKETTERYNNLPEVRGRREEEKTNRKKVEKQIKTKVFAKKIQRQVLNQL